MRASNNTLPQRKRNNNCEGCVSGWMAIHPDTHPSQLLLRLRCGNVLLLARITARGAHDLGLQAGMPAWAQVKSVALVK